MRHTPIKKLMILAAIVAMAGCATKPAPDYAGRWKPVNRFSDSAMEIPLYTSYVYQATPMDGTLKGMLERWAKDSQMDLSYNLSSDYTLFRPVTDIDTTSVQQAVAKLSEVYAKQGVSVSVVGNRILVQPVGTSNAGASAGSGTSAAPDKG